MTNASLELIRGEKTDYPAVCAHELFEAAAAKWPDNRALADESGFLSYRELNARADALASALRGSPRWRLEAPVGIHIDRCNNFALACLAVLKAGCFYAPLDPSYPEERLRSIVSQVGAEIILTERSREGTVKSFAPEAEIIFADDSALLSKTVEPTGKIPGLTTRSLAYAVFTSGSTGAPKGIAVEHRSLVNLVTWHQRAFSLGHGSKMAQSAKVGFDASVWEIWSVLTTGAELCFIPREILLLPEALLEWFDARGVEQCFLPTPVAEAFMAAPGAMKTRLKFLHTGGDRLTRRPPEGFPARLINNYGPSECAVVSTSGDVSLMPDSPGGSIPIGKPLSNVITLILDESGGLCAPGEKGELFIAGDCLARGYIGSEELTKERFVELDIPGVFKGRAYRSGDSGAFMPGGNIEFFGRLDFQIKILGNRIEPAEIENAVCQFESVSGCAAGARVVDGRKSLVAWVSLKDNRAPFDREALRGFLSAKIPAYMCPSYFVTMDKLPLTPNGKIDRAALPDPETARRDSAAETSAMTETELKVAAVWRDTLGVGFAGPDDNFFELGGDSLSAARIAARLNSLFSASVSISSMMRYPTVRKISATIDSHSGSPGKAAVFELSAARPRRCPLSYSQHGLWLLWRLNPDRLEFNIHLEITFRGAMDPAALREALRVVTERHGMLRTGFHDSAGEPFLQPLSKAAPEPPFTDLSALPEAERRKSLLAAEAKDQEEPFDLESGPLFRASLLKMGGSEYVMLLTIHHIIIDGWSAGLMFKDMSLAYRDLTAGRTPSFSTPAGAYADYCFYQERAMEDGRWAAQLEYWRGVLSEPPPPLNLSALRQRPPVPSGRGERFPWSVRPDIFSGVRRLASECSVSVFTVALAVFKTLLARRCSADDIVVGTPYASRNELWMEGIFGLMTNLLALRTKITKNITFRELAELEKNVCVSAYANSDIPFDYMTAELGLPRDPSRHPVFQVMIIQQNFPYHEFSAFGVPLNFRDTGNKTAKLDLTLNIEEKNGGLECWFEFNTDIFSCWQIGSLAARMTELFETLAADPGTEIGQIPALGAAEYNAVVYGFNSSVFEFPADKSWPEVFASRVSGFSGRPAVKFGEHELTYAEFDFITGHAAAALTELGAAPGSPVAVAVDRGEWIPLGLAAALKSGAPYVPVDTEYPEERIKYILENSGAKVLLADDESLAKMPRLDMKTLRVSSFRAGSAAPVVLARRPLPGDAAYIMHTSGSTGRPKGVEISHRNLLSHNFAVMRGFALTPEDRVMQFGTVCFDISVEEIFPSLLAGAELIVRPAGVTDSMDIFLDFTEKELITVLDIPTAFWHELAAALGEGRRVPPSLRLVIIGGEKASPEHLLLWKKHAPGVRLLNTYGPTEATVIATMCDAASLPCPDAPDEFPIGKPLPNSAVYILDSDMAPVPCGKIGALYIGGAGVARGYINAPELNAEKFRPDPFVPGGRLYSTGDLACRAGDGTVLFRGRADFQIKIRGRRIEPGEIEREILAFPGVREAAVTAFSRGSSDTLLAAYLSADNPDSFDKEGLRSALARRLPEYMLPQHIGVLVRLPHTSSGKIDRKSLPKPETSVSDRPDYEPPRTPMETTLCEIMSEALGGARVGISDNFFRLGGNSLLAMRVIAKLGRAGVQLGIARMMRLPTVRDMAAAAEPASPAETGQDHHSSACLVELQAGRSDEVPVFLVHPPSGYLINYAPLVMSFPGSRPVYGFQSPGLFDKNKILRSVKETASYYLERLLEFYPCGPYVIGGWCFGGLVAYEMAVMMKKHDIRCALVFMIDTPALKPSDPRLMTMFLAEKLTALMRMPLRGKIQYLKTKIRDAVKGKYYDKIIPENHNIAEGPNVINRGVVWRANVNAFLSHKVTPSEQRVVLFTGTKKEYDMINTPSLGWRCSDPAVELVEIPANHDTIIDHANSKAIAEYLESLIQKI